MMIFPVLTVQVLVPMVEVAAAAAAAAAAEVEVEDHAFFGPHRLR